MIFFAVGKANVLRIHISVLVDFPIEFLSETNVNRTFSSCIVVKPDVVRF